MAVKVAEPKYKVPEAAKLLGQAEKTTWNWIALQKIAVYRVGRSVLVPESEIARILQDGFCPAKP
jgi:excisionase family DNA binding protein